MKNHACALPHQAGGGDAAKVSRRGAADGNAGPTQTVPTEKDQSCFLFVFRVLLVPFHLTADVCSRGYQSEPGELALRTRGRSLRNGRFHRAARRSRHSSKGRSATFVVVTTVVITDGLPLTLRSPPQSRRGGPGLMRMLRVTFCSRQRTPLLLSLYLLTVHVLLLLCMGGYL